MVWGPLTVLDICVQLLQSVLQELSWDTAILTVAL